MGYRFPDVLAHVYAFASAPDDTSKLNVLGATQSCAVPYRQYSGNIRLP